MEALSLYELNNMVHNCLKNNLAEEYWVQGELSDVRQNASGHCYFEMVQKDERGTNAIAKARGMVFANLFRFIKPFFENKTGQTFTSGIKVLVKVNVNFHEAYGFSLIVKEIDPTYTLGEMANKRREILNQLMEEGIAEMNKELQLPTLIKKVAVISSATAAGYGDFAHQLTNNKYGLFFATELFPAVMQGEKTEESILSALENIMNREEEFDAVVIIRGGGATSDFSGFETYLLAASIAQFPMPVIVGIGHERDSTVLDDVANVSVKTPTAAAEFIINRSLEAAMELNRLTQMLAEATRYKIEKETNKLHRLTSQIPSAAIKYIGSAKMRLERVEANVINGTKRLLINKKHKLSLIEQRIIDHSPQGVLNRGYGILQKNGKIIKSAKELKKGEKLVVRMKDGEINVIVE